MCRASLGCGLSKMLVKGKDEVQGQGHWFCDPLKSYNVEVKTSRGDELSSRSCASRVGTEGCVMPTISSCSLSAAAGN